MRRIILILTSSGAGASPRAPNPGNSTMPDGNVNISPDAVSDQPEAAAPEVSAKASREKAKRKTEKKRKQAPVPRSHGTVAFPYHDLSAAIDIARKILDKGAHPLSREQLAGALGQNPSTGSFNLKVGAARMFGVIETVQGKYQLTQLGFSIADNDETRHRAAKVSAFLKVPLYKAVYEKYRGNQLPPRPHGLEQAFVQFGVPPKQKANARYAFDRSAQQAGFFENSRDRLVEPIVGPASYRKPQESEPAGDQQRIEPDHGSFGLGGWDGPELDPLILALLRKIPEPSDPWPLASRARWLRTFAMNLAQIYQPGEGEDGDAEIRVTVGNPRSE
jgi:hypothetical protein